LSRITVSIFGNQEKTRDGIAVEVGVEHRAGLEVHFLGQGVTQAHRDAAFHLLLHALGVDHEAHFLRAQHALDGDLAADPVDGDLGDGGDVAAGIHADGHAQAAAADADGGLPAPFLRGGLEHMDRAGVGEMF
jgi:hypothetical protein